MPKKLPSLRRSAQDIQDAIFRKMSAEQKIRLASDFSAVVLKRNKHCAPYEIPDSQRTIDLKHLKKWASKHFTPTILKTLLTQ